MTPPAVRIPVVVGLVHQDLLPPRLGPVRKGEVREISAAQQMIRASGSTDESPVTMPTFAAPKTSTRAKNLSPTRA